MEGRTYLPTDASFPNPERGGCVYINDSELFSEGVLQEIRQKGYTLAFASIPLDSYRRGNISRDFLQNLERGFANARKAGVKVIPRFKYTDDGDAPLSTVLRHIDQLTPALRRNADVIAAMQAGFIGSYGEWHSSANGLEGCLNAQKVLERLLKALPPSRAIELRQPVFKAWALEVIKYGKDAAALSSRLGHHNDCLGANATDAGTYPSDEIEEWKAYVADDLPNTPVGGETCPAQGERMTCFAAEVEMRRLRWSHLSVSNESYDKGVISGWRAGGCFDRILRNLGYRFALKKASWSSDAVAGGSLHVQASIINSGYAAPINERPVYAMIEGAGLCFAAKLPTDARSFLPGETSELSYDLSLPTAIPAGKYRLSLWLPDPAQTLMKDPRFAIRFANVGTWRDERGANVLTENLTIGEREPQTPREKTDAAFAPCKI
jgi:hypothetical protein